MSANSFWCLVILVDSESSESWFSELQVVVVGEWGGVKTDAQRGVERQREKNQRTGLTVHQRGRRPPPPVLRRLGCAAA